MTKDTSGPGWGEWLHNAIETHPIPEGLVGQQTAVGKLPERLFPVFIDRKELPTSADLPHAIVDALDRSRFLIVICSPNSARSKWVQAEVMHFKRTGRANRILALIIAGEPNATEKVDFDRDQECF